MILTIWRHGEASIAASDRERPLTPRGRHEVATGATRFRDWCGARGVAPPTSMLHSPWLRTEETAKILAAELTGGLTHPLEALQPGTTIDAVDAALDALSPQMKEGSHILLVSHQPLVSRLVDYYLGKRGIVPGLPPGGLACISLDVPAAGCGNLLCWAFPPDYEACQ